ncbi:MAG: DUF4340 domain-containing protein [Chloroflexi bacterium]|nr:MAG: DUF4340 domain-containing protein [Chloroflexota bacterium]
MNWRTTAVLFVILVLLGGYVFYQSRQEPVTPTPTPLPPTPERVPLVSEDTTIEQVNTVSVRRLADNNHTTFFRDGQGNWLRTVPTQTVAISLTVNTQVTGLINLRSNRTFPPDLNPLAAYGLDEPTYEIVLDTLQDEQLHRTVLLVGNKTPAGDAYYVQKKGDPRVHVVSAGVIQNMINLLENPPLQPTPTPTAVLTDTVELTVTPGITITTTPTTDE